MGRKVGRSLGFCLNCSLVNVWFFDLEICEKAEKTHGKIVEICSDFFCCELCGNLTLNGGYL